MGQSPSTAAGKPLAVYGDERGKTWAWIQWELRSDSSAFLMKYEYQPFVDNEVRQGGQEFWESRTV